MSTAIAPRRPMARWWVALTLALLAPALLPSLPASRAQAPSGDGKKADPTKPKGDAKAAAKAPAKDEDDEEAVAEKKAAAAAEEKVETPDRWEDPRASAAMKNNFPELPAVASPPADKDLVTQLALGRGQLDLATIDRFVKNRAAILTNRANLKALADPGGNPSAAKNIENAGMDLLGPLLQPPTAANKTFRDRYIAKLIEVLKPVMAGNLHSRTMAMIVLSRAGDSQVVPFLASQLSDPDQLAIVKTLAAKGIALATQDGRRDLEAAVALPAAKALSDFLVREPDTFWYAQLRATEALGSLRQATEKPLNGKAELADTAMLLLTNPKAAPDVRAWASWALGMMTIPQSVRNFNFALVAQAAGQAAADIGDKITAMPAGSQIKVVRLANLLLQINLAFTGEPDARNSGLLTTSNAAPYVSDVAKRVQALTRAALDLGNAVGNQVPQRKQAVASAVADLRAILAKPPAGPRSLYAGGPEFPEPAAPAKVAAGARP